MNDIFLNAILHLLTMKQPFLFLSPSISGVLSRSSVLLSGDEIKNELVSVNALSGSERERA